MQERRTTPLKKPPVRNPGEGLDAEMADLRELKLFPYIVASTMTVAFAVVEWIQWLNTPRQPWWLTITAIGVIIFTYVRFRRVRARYRDLKLGRDGEKAVGQYLERLRTDGFAVLHDIPGDGFNLDHVLVSTRGIFVVETKTLRKTDDRQATLRFDGTDVRVAGHALPRNPVPQVRANMAWLATLLEEETSRRFAVRGVVLFPGWFVESTPGAPGDVWVLEPKCPY